MLCPQHFRNENARSHQINIYAYCKQAAERVRTPRPPFPRLHFCTIRPTDGRFMRAHAQAWALRAARAVRSTTRWLYLTDTCGEKMSMDLVDTQHRERDKQHNIHTLSAVL